MKTVPRWLLVLGGGPVGVELAQAVRRFGASVVIIEHATRVLVREPAALGEALGEVLRRDGIELELELGVSVVGAHREARTTCWNSTISPLPSAARAGSSLLLPVEAVA
jgi:pyruvate/2-oxoglutarate dehydrogenase complex dihydrolipoamide dehydrogenase (E3) component